MPFQHRRLKPLLNFPYYQIALPVLRRMNLARPSAFDYAAYWLQKMNVAVTGILDVGAFDGTMARHMADLFPRAEIFAFEPSPESFALLQATARRQPRIKPFALAISDENGQTVLNVNRSPVTNSLLSVLDSPERDAVLGAGGETVKRVPCEMMRLDDFLQKHPDRRFQLLKTDAQGLDLRVLHGAERALCDSIRAVIAEFHFFSVVYQGDTTYLEMMDEYLARLGFRLTAIPGISPNLATGRAFSADGLWIRP